jgi:threonine/homoserine/homoserine lactone efflux protein
VVENFDAFLIVAVLVIVTPGPDTALTIRNTLLGGRRAGVATAVGVAAGQTAWSVATAAGVATVLIASEPVFRATKLIGAAYLAFLGAQALYGAPRRRPASEHAAELGPAAARLAPPARGATRFDQQPDQPEDGRVLPRAAAAIRARG